MDKTIDRRAATCFAGTLALAVAVLLLALALLPGQALAKSGTYVFDEYDVFTQTQFDTLEAKAKEVSEANQIGVYFLTVSTMNGNLNPTSSQRNSYAGAYYREHGLGMGSAKDGMIFVVAVDSRDYVTWANGLPWTEALSERGVETLEDAVTDELSGNNWYDAATVYYEQAGRQLAYYTEHGTALEPLDAFDMTIRILIVLLVPLVAAGLYVSRGISAMRTAKQKTQAADYLQRESLVVTRATDRFLHTTHTATRRSDDSDSGGGGGWGGGGSSGGSGGGKF